MSSFGSKLIQCFLSMSKKPLYEVDHGVLWGFMGPAVTKALSVSSGEQDWGVSNRIPALENAMSLACRCHEKQESERKVCQAMGLG